MGIEKLTQKFVSDMNTSLRPYQGTAPYIFASYSHEDENIIFDQLERLVDRGYRVWYDEGISPGGEWPEEIARAIENCTYFIVYITPNAVASKHA